MNARLETPVRLMCWDESPGPGEPFLAVDGGGAPEAGCRAWLVLPREREDRARELLDAGIAKVFIGAAALRDATLIERLAAEYGGARVGVYAPLRRMPVSWSMDSSSNADFKFVTPSICEPCWEVQDADGGATGTLAGWWLARLLEGGAGEALVQVDFDDDTDLRIAARVVEQTDGRLWFSPRRGDELPLPDLIERAGARRFVLPAARLAHHAALLPATGGVAEAAG